MNIFPPPPLFFSCPPIFHSACQHQNPHDWNVVYSRIRCRRGGECGRWLQSGSFNVCMNSDLHVLSSGWCRSKYNCGVGNGKCIWVICFFSAWYTYACLYNISLIGKIRYPHTGHHLLITHNDDEWKKTYTSYI